MPDKAFDGDLHISIFLDQVHPNIDFELILLGGVVEGREYRMNAIRLTILVLFYLTHDLSLDRPTSCYRSISMLFRSGHLTPIKLAIRSPLHDPQLG